MREVILRSEAMKDNGLECASDTGDASAATSFGYMNAAFRYISFLFAISTAASCATRDAARDGEPSPEGKTADSAAAKPRVAPPPSIVDGPADTTRPSLLPVRKKHDSATFISAVTFGRRKLASWPAMPAVRPGSILPAKRIVAFYGNPLSKRMGVLGEYAPDTMLAKLDTIVREWEKADPTTPVQPALHLIAVVAQGSAGRDGMWRARMDSALIEKVYGWAKQRNAVLFLDIQIGKSTVQRELPPLLRFLERPDVHLGLDPEFSMHHSAEGSPPGRRIGQLDAADINWVSEQLRNLVDEKKIPPKVLVVHRFTKPMVLRASQITLDPRVQIVMHMDGWGPPWMKFESYRDYIDLEPVQFTGFKLFFHNDTKRGDLLLTPSELLWLRPRPLYIQYQ
jgi:hypothetical protein